MQYRLAESKINLSRLSYAWLIVLGLIGIGFNFNNYISEDVNNLSPFIPYKFVWSDSFDN